MDFNSIPIEDINTESNEPSFDNIAIENVEQVSDSNVDFDSIPIENEIVGAIVDEPVQVKPKKIRVKKVKSDKTLENNEEIEVKPKEFQRRKRINKLHDASGYII